MATETAGVREATAAPEAEVFDLKLLNPVLAEFKSEKGAVIPILQRAEELYGYLPKEVMVYLSKKTGFPLSRLYGVATFYSQFHLKRRGRHIIKICDGTACHVRGAPKNLDAVTKEMGIAPGETSPDYRYTVEVVYCLGSCGLAPVAVMDEKVHGRLTPDLTVSSMADLK